MWKLLSGWKGYAAAGLVGSLLISAVLFERHLYGKAQYKDGYQTAQTEYKLLAAKAEQEARTREHELQGQIDHVRTEYESIVEQASLAAAAVGAESVSLREQLTAANRRAASHASRAGLALDENARLTAELRNVVGMCTDRYSGLAAEADKLRGDLIGLQRWARTVRK